MAQGKEMRLEAAIGVLCMSLGVGSAAQAASERLVHRYLDVEISPNGELVASVEGDSSKSGGAPTVRDLLIRHVSGGAAITIPMPCGRVPQCWPDSPAWSADGKHLSFALRTPGSHARSLYTVDADGNGLSKLLDFSGTIVRLRYLPDGRLAMLAIQNATKEVGATQAGAAIAGDLDAPPPEQRIAVLEHGALRWVSPPDLFVYEYDWRGTGKGFIGTAAAATATTIGGRRNCMPLPKTARMHASSTLRPMLANNLRCRRFRATAAWSRSSRAS